jgi:hypothetical protein
MSKGGVRGRRARGGREARGDGKRQVNEDELDRKQAAALKVAADSRKTLAAWKVEHERLRQEIAEVEEAGADKAWTKREALKVSAAKRAEAERLLEKRRLLEQRQVAAAVEGVPETPEERSAYMAKARAVMAAAKEAEQAEVWLRGEAAREAAAAEARKRSERWLAESRAAVERIRPAPSGRLADAAGTLAAVTAALALVAGMAWSCAGQAPSPGPAGPPSYESDFNYENGANTFPLEDPSISQNDARETSDDQRLSPHLGVERSL